MADKTKSQTFQQITTQQNIKDIVKDSQIRIKNKHGEYKSRHGGWTAKYINDLDYTKEISQTDVIEEKSADNFSKYTYNSVTFLGDDKKLIKKLIIEKESLQKILIWQKSNDDKILLIQSKIKAKEIKLKEIDDKLKNSSSFGKKRLNKIQKEFVKYKQEINIMNLELSKLEDENKQINEYLKINDNIKSSLIKNIEKFEKNDNKNNTKILIKNSKKIKKLKKDMNKTKNLKTELKYKNIILQLEEEIKEEKIKNNKKVMQIYEEILKINNNCYYITTFVHRNKSITEKIMFFHNFGNNNIKVLIQTKQYKNINDYQKSTSLIDNNENKNMHTIPIKEFVKKQTEDKIKPSKMDWIIWTGLTVLSLGIVFTPWVSSFFGNSMPKEFQDKGLFGFLGAIIKGISSIFSLATKKVESRWFNKMFKNKEEKEKEKKDIESKIENLTNNDLEKRLKTQYDILKQELDNKKNKKINELMNYETNYNSNSILKNSNIKPLNINNFDSYIRNTANHESQPLTSKKTHNLNLT